MPRNSQLVLLLMCLCFFIYGFWPFGGENRISRQVASQKPQHIMSPEMLIDEYKNNLIRAKSKYEGKVIQIESRGVSRIWEDNGTAFVSFYAEGRPVWCSFASQDEDVLMNIEQRGMYFWSKLRRTWEDEWEDEKNRLVLKGRLEGRFENGARYIWLRGCQKP